MKILIVDDEALVRNGLKNSINWESLGISTVLLADDGVQAVRLAHQEQPAIILTDVRMPRMDGIEMATRLRQLLPDTRLIFMSGYSDKEYLKAAIHLKAVSYVEKPIDLREVEAAVAEAVRLHKEHTSNRDAQIVRSYMEKAQLAVALTQMTDQNEETIRRAWNALGLPPGNKLWFSVVLVHLTDVSHYDELSGLTDFLHRLQETAQQKQLAFLYSNRNESRILFHLYRQSELTREQVVWFTSQLRGCLNDRYHFFIAAGSPVQGLRRIPVSYQSAAETLNRGFFSGLNAVLLWDEAKQPSPSIDLDGCIADFLAAVSAAEYEKARQREETLYQDMLRHAQLPADVIKNTYYQFISILERVATKSCIPFSRQEQSPWQIVSECHTAHELHKYFLDMMEEYVRLAEGEREENELIFLMKDYVRKNYQQDYLSVQEVANAVGLSTAYACTLFRQETGGTINRFIVNYRVERAKQLLANPRFRITNIASQLGFADSNYFGKCFKRIVGLSPSEYREKVSRWGG